MGIKINQLPDLTNVAGTDMFPADDSGGTTGKHTLAKIAEYAVSAFEITLGGISRTVKTAIDAIQTLLGSTSISGIGDGTVTGAISSLNSDLAKTQSIPYSIFQNRVTFTMGFAYQITDRLVFVYFKGTANQALQSNTIIQGLPVPSFAQGFMCNIGGAYAEIRANATDGILMYGVPNGASFVFGGVYTLL